MNGRRALVVLPLLWIASVVAAYLAGSHQADSSSLSMAEQPAPPGTASRPISVLGNDSTSPTGSGGTVTSPAPGTAVTPPRDVASLVAAALRGFGTGNAPLYDSLSLYRVMEPLLELSPDEVQTALSEVERMVADPQQKAALQSLLMAKWAEQDPRAAMGYAEKTIAKENGPRSVGMIYSVMSSWANRDPEAAWTWYQEKRDRDELPEDMMSSRAYSQMIFTGMAAKNLDLALTRMAGLSDPDDQAMAASGVAASTKPENWKRILAATSSFDQDTRRSAQSMILSQWATRDFDGTVKLLQDLPQEESKELLDNSGDSLMWANPKKMAELLLATATEENLRQRYSTIVGSWAFNNPNAAAEWLNRQPPSPAQDNARAQFANIVVRKDPEAAMAWARTVTDASQRQNAVRQVVTMWSKRDPSAADAALAASGLPAKQVETIRKSIAKPRK